MRCAAEQAEDRAARAAGSAHRDPHRGRRGTCPNRRAELHDIVAHSVSVSVMVLQVGAVRHRLPQSLAEDKDALSDVEKAGRGALD